MSASDIEHAADEIAKFLREADSSYIRISVFLDTKEIENIKNSISSVEIGILNWRLGGASACRVWRSSGEFSKSERGGRVMFSVEGWDERGVRAGSFVMVEETDKYYG